MSKADVAMRWVIEKIKQGDYTLKNGKLISYTNRGLGKEVGVLSKNGYLTFRGYCEGKRVRFYLHRLVWEFYNGEIPKGITINHINGDKLDNRIENLELMTRSENLSHAHRTGLQDKKGEKHHNVKLTKEQVLEIDKRINNGESIVKLANEFNMHEQSIYDIKYRKKWKHVLN